MTTKSRAERARQAAAFRRGLLRWYRRHGRDLPWRRTRDPYHIVVSEFMLQQTQVSRVEAYYHRFLERFPTIDALAAAPRLPCGRAGKGWATTAARPTCTGWRRRWSASTAGVMPSDPVVLAKLPGVGRYTAGAVACFAYERVAATVDTNVARVIRRAFHPRLGGRTVPKRIWETALEILPRHGKRAWEVNQAMMELGALICTARVARCGTCPVRRACRTGTA